MPLLQRYAAKIVQIGECLIWTGGKDCSGYGKLRNGRIHRWVYERILGPIPAGCVLHHLCRQRACVNLLHLEVIPRRGHAQAHLLERGPSRVGAGSPLAKRNAQKTHCKSGHALRGANVRMRGTWRQCRACEGWTGYGG